MSRLGKSLLTIVVILALLIVPLYFVNINIKKFALPKLNEVGAEHNVKFEVDGPIKVSLGLPLNPTLTVKEATIRLMQRNTEFKYGRVQNVNLKLAVLPLLQKQYGLALQKLTIANANLYKRDLKAKPDYVLKDINISGVNASSSYLELNSHLGELPINLATKVEQRKEQIIISPKITLAGNSSIAGDIYIGGIEGAYYLKIDLKSNNFKYGKIINVYQKEKLLIGGNGSLSIKLEGDAATLDNLNKNMYGRILIDAGSGSINRNVQPLTSDILQAINSNIIPFGNKNSNEFHCFVANMQVKHSVASMQNSLAVEMPEVNLIGKGSIGLVDKKLNLTIAPIKKDNVVLDGITLAEMVQITGTIDKPKVGVNAEQLVKKAGSLAAAILSGGSSVAVESIFSPEKSSAHPCMDAKNWGQK